MAATYRALTRKYRPQSFDDVVSQEHVSSTLKNAIAQNRLSHAYMFCGPRGVGKTTMARVLARAINNIDDSVDGESLSQTLNVVEIDAASNNKVEDVHHLREIVRVPPQTGSYKVFIIDEVHMLSKQAFNALLKTLEEPPSHAIFIFATTEPHKVIPTILSRVQRFDFKRISVDEIVERLKFICDDEEITIDNESLHTIAKKADGALRDALGLMDQAIAFCGTHVKYGELVKALNVIGNDDLFEFTDTVASNNSQAGLLLIDRLLKDGADIQEFLVSLTAHLRNLYVAKHSEQLHLVEATEETKERYRKSAKSFSDKDLLRMLHLVSEAQVKIRDVQQPRVHFEILMLKLVHMSRSKELNQLLTELDHIKKNGSNTVAEPGPGANRAENSENSASGRINYEQDAPAAKEVVSEKPGTGHQSEKHGSNQKQTTPKSEAENRAEEFENPVGDESEDENDFQELLMGRPSLGFKRQAEAENGEENVNLKNAEDEIEKEHGLVHSLEDVEADWNRVLGRLQQQASKMLYLQCKDLQLTDLKGTELVISVSNQFAANIIEENKQMLSNVIKETIGVYLRLKCVVKNMDRKSSESLSPFDRFKEVQKKDAHLRTIVDLFGAEIEYSG